MKRLALLGSTGSIGTQTLEVVRGLEKSRCPVKIEVLAARSNIRLLEEQIREFRPAAAAVFDPDAARELRTRVRDLDITVLEGMDGLCEAAAWETADITLNAVVGMVGLRPTLAAISAKKTLALANKETLVAGGSLVMEAARENGVKILPVDSEHSAIFQCLQGCPSPEALNRLILTASGGPFFGKSREELREITPEQALRHPNWEMGAKVTIDSATLMNKGLEVIEASWLFGVPPEQIEVVVHRESIVHSLIEYRDHSVLAQLGQPDMRIPIQYALTYPQRFPSPVKRLELWKQGNLTFFPPDLETFRCLPVCIGALKRGGLAPAAANGANEKAVELFLSKKISFLEIGQLVFAAVENQPDAPAASLEAVLEADLRARQFVESCC
ncbi:1-deoxy-D-xylulose-5-phosphate reductoisomerase [Neglectibacter caecimuris]|uniref:1-deoxy-D-xylulose-5-phosphate reductoisomerase n=1 Tax=Neglectibacter caecimuris TaxID=3093658 RepID=UPI002AC95B10|nr:1-deoxy-D-xylulose-5-phosphate reductoisomerase [Neglectibacter sp. M00184]